MPPTTTTSIAIPFKSKFPAQFHSIRTFPHFPHSNPNSQRNPIPFSIRTRNSAQIPSARRMRMRIWMRMQMDMDMDTDVEIMPDSNSGSNSNSNSQFKFQLQFKAGAELLFAVWPTKSWQSGRKECLAKKASFCLCLRQSQSQRQRFCLCHCQRKRRSSSV